MENSLRSSVLPDAAKTTLLNLLSGFDQPTSGTIERKGESRMVHQKDGLFPWLTVSENIALGLRGIEDEDRRKKQVEDLLGLIRLETFEDSYPHQLSGGMRQRVELARALAGLRTSCCWMSRSRHWII